MIIIFFDCYAVWFFVLADVSEVRIASISRAQDGDNMYPKNVENTGQNHTIQKLKKRT
jgi:hypothetical protein